MQIKLIKTERALSPTQIELADFVINPYKGCQVGCLYCYTRSNSAIKKINKQWGSYVYVKENFEILLQNQIAALLNEGHIIKRVLIGSTTEVFQPIEEEYHITRGILQILKANDIPVVVLTKSSLVSNYIPLLSYSEKNKVYVTYNSNIVRGLFEKESSLMHERIKAAENLQNGCIDTIIYVSPVFPGLTDAGKIFKELAGKVRKIYFESYSTKPGNWDDVKARLVQEGLQQTVKTIEGIYESKQSYDDYWNQFKKQVETLNSEYGYQLDFFIYPYDAYYGEK